MQLQRFLRLVRLPVIFVIFAVCIVPVALLMRLVGKRPLRLAKRPDLNSYWIEKAPMAPNGFKNQF